MLKRICHGFKTIIETIKLQWKIAKDEYVIRYPLRIFTDEDLKIMKEWTDLTIRLQTVQALLIYDDPLDPYEDMIYFDED